MGGGAYRKHYLNSCMFFKMRKSVIWVTKEMLYREIVAVCSDIHIKQINAL